MAKSEEQDGRAVGAAPPSAEAKRLEARRRFLLGAGATLPVVLSFGVREARAAGFSVCGSLGMGQGGGNPDAPPTFVCELRPH